MSVTISSGKSKISFTVIKNEEKPKEKPKK